MAKSITYNNKTYKSIKQLAKDYNIPYTTLLCKLNKGWSIEKTIETLTTSIKTILTYKNKTYSSITELAKNYNIPYHILRQRLKRGITIDEAINKPIRTNNKKITYKNKTYNSLKELSKEYNVSYGLLIQRINKQKWSIKNAIEIPIGYTKNKPITYKNKIYTTTTKLAKDYNIPINILHSRLYEQNWPIEKAVETPVKTIGKKITYKNKTYTSIHKLSEEYNVPYNTIRRRLNQKWSIKKAIETPVKPHIPKGFNALALAYTHNNIDYYECIHNKQKYILSIQEMKNFTKKNNDRNTKYNST